MEKPNQFELDLVRAILGERKDSYPRLWAQIRFLRVRSRELTGVGAYVNFELSTEGHQFIEPDFREGVLGAAKNVEMDTVPSGLGCALCISEGKISFLELFTYGDEEWDGKVGHYRIIDT